MSRDTDADWIRLAETEPHFGVLANPEFLSEHLDDEAIERFFGHGRDDIAFAVNTIRERVHAAFAPQTAVDFGCGVGRLTLAMSEHARHVIGVDVAPAMLDLAMQAADGRGVTNVEFRHAAPEAGIDWLNSLIVFQHIPPERGLPLLESLAAAVVIGGVISLQLTTHRDARHLHEINRDVDIARYDGRVMTVLRTAEPGEVGHMSMFDYDLGLVLALLTRIGFDHFWLHHTDHAGVHGYWVFSRRDR